MSHCSIGLTPSLHISSVRGGATVQPLPVPGGETAKPRVTEEMSDDSVFGMTMYDMATRDWVSAPGQRDPSRFLIHSV